MNNPCKIIQDLLPLYKDDVCSVETKLFVEEHIRTCSLCKSELQQIRDGMAEPHKYRRDEKIAKAVSVAWRKKKRVSTVKGFAIATAIFILVIMLFYVPYTKSGMKTTVRVWEKQMTAFAESQLLLGVERTSNIVGYKVSIYPDSGCVFFAHSGMDYDGIYYSAGGKPTGFQGTDADFIVHGKGWLWKEANGDNWMYVEWIAGNWFWYEMHF